MANPNRVNQPEIEKSEQTVLNQSFDREFNVLAVETLVYNPDTGAMDRMTQPGASSGGNVLADYGIQAISEDATYKYFFFEDSSANWYILRKHLVNATFDYAKGTGGYASVYVDAVSGPSGSPAYGSKGTIF